MSPNPFDQPDTPTPEAAAARDWATRAVAGMVAAADPDAFTERPLFPGSAATVRRPRPLPAARAALTLAAAAEAEAHADARRARSEGASWAEVAAGLGFDQLDARDLGGRSPAEHAFEWAAPSGFPAVCRWDCSACAQRVTDCGPYDPHPDDQERGHARGCARHAADLAAWHAAHGD